MYRIGQISLKVSESKEDIPKKIQEKLKKKIKIEDYRIIKESIDARKKNDIKLIYTVDFNCKEKLDLPPACSPACRRGRADRLAGQSEYKFDVVLKVQPKHRPVVVGFGPCGIFAALTLAQLGLKPIVLERGKNVDDRTKDVLKFWEEGILNTESNVQFGEGGAGTFSDGKLTTGIKN
ncbi:MAG: NAD(P)/FAD-dependent oxidoreductase, partial [Anaerovoracaceae bacterium]